MIPDSAIIIAIISHKLQINNNNLNNILKQYHNIKHLHPLCHTHTDSLPPSHSTILLLYLSNYIQQIIYKNIQEQLFGKFQR